MPLIISGTINSTGPIAVQGGVGVTDTQNTQTQIVATQIQDVIATEGIGYQEDGIISSSGALSLTEALDPIYGALTTQLFFQELEAGFSVVPSILDAVHHPMRLVVGRPPIAINPFRVHTPLYLTQKNCISVFQGGRVRAGFSTVPNTQSEFGVLIASGVGLTVSGDLNLIDVLGPELFNLIPSSGSEFNDPSTTVSFDLIDTGGSDIVSSGVDIYVNGTQVIDAGIDVTPSGFGSTTFTAVSPTFYEFLFIPSGDFTLGSTVNISGVAFDSVTPSANVTNFSYDFQVWDLGDLAANISGAPDITAPSLLNLDPFSGEIEVPVDSNIYLEIVDEHTGVDFSTLRIFYRNALIVSGTTNVNTSLATATLTPISGGKSISVDIDPVINMNFSETVQIEVQASDLFDTPNELDTSYLFITQTNSQLLASGLQIFQDAVYTDMDIDETYVTTSSTMFVIDYLNTSGTPLNVSGGSNVQLNGVVIPSSFVSVTGSNAHYQVFFDLEPDYEEEAILTFHVQQSGTVSGNIVSRDFNTRLLWGYEVCYDSSRPLPREQDFYTTIQVCDFADAPSLGSEIKEFSSELFRKNDLIATIYPKLAPAQDITAEYLSNNATFQPGKTMDLVLEASDFAGNELIFSWSFTIEG